MDAPVTVLILGSLWWLTAAGQFYKYLGGAGLIVSFLLALGLVAAYLRFRPAPTAEPSRFAGRAPLFLALFAALVFAILYPLAREHLIGPGSDRADALTRGLHALLSRRNPYTQHTYLGNSIDILPGAFVFALPFHFLGTVSLQNVFWMLILILFMPRFIPDRMTAVAFAAFLLINPGVMQDYVTGGDYVVNGIIVLVAARAVCDAYEGNSLVVSLVAIVFFTVALAIRPIYALVGIAIALKLLRDQSTSDAVFFVFTVAAVFLIVTAGFYLQDPRHFAPLHVLHKANPIPVQLLAPASVLPLLAIFFVDSNWANFTLICGAAVAVLIVPPLVAQMIAGRVILDPYAFAVLLFAGIGILAREPLAG